jgi:hypothetical protein
VTRKSLNQTLSRLRSTVTVLINCISAVFQIDTIVLLKASRGAGDGSSKSFPWNIGMMPSYRIQVNNTDHNKNILTSQLE